MELRDSFVQRNGQLAWLMKQARSRKDKARIKPDLPALAHSLAVKFTSSSSAYTYCCPCASSDAFRLADHHDVVLERSSAVALA